MSNYVPPSVFEGSPLSESLPKFDLSIPFIAKVLSLTQREFAVFRSLNTGDSIPCIAKHLGISTRTFWTHCTNAKNKLGLDGVAELRVFSVRYDLYSRFYKTQVLRTHANGRFVFITTGATLIGPKE